jgi:hypothetical protein
VRLWLQADISTAKAIGLVAILGRMIVGIVMAIQFISALERSEGLVGQAKRITLGFPLLPLRHRGLPNPSHENFESSV